jgi:transcription elongation GreA/GreB family factor
LLADADDEQRWLFLAPDAAGLKVELDQESIMLITPHSPMGKGLLGLAQDSEVSLQVGNRQQHFGVLAIY